MAATEMGAHYDIVADSILDGEVVPLLGAGVNLCGRPERQRWSPGKDLPSGKELARYLAKTFRLPADENNKELIRVAQYAIVMLGSGKLYKTLHEALNLDCRPTKVHAFLASLPRTLRERGREPPCQLIVTTNYDDALEHAFVEAGEPFDLITYIAEGKYRGKFLHWPPGKTPPEVIEKPNEYVDVSPDERTVILKLHGDINRSTDDWAADSYVITEDHYIDYLTRADISTLIPVKLAQKLRDSHFLFLGYSMRDWNLRVILHRIWGEQTLSWKSWAIQRGPREFERTYWTQRGVEVLDVDLEDYIDELGSRLGP